MIIDLIKNSSRYIKIILFIFLFAGNYFNIYFSVLFYIYLAILLFIESQKDKQFIFTHVTFWAAAFMFYNIKDEFETIRKLTFIPFWFIFMIAFGIVHVSIKCSEDKFDNENKEAHTNEETQQRRRDYQETT